MPQFTMRKPGCLSAHSSVDPRRRRARRAGRTNTRRSTSSRACAFLGAFCPGRKDRPMSTATIPTTRARRGAGHTLPRAAHTIPRGPVVLSPSNQGQPHGATAPSGLSSLRPYVALRRPTCRWRRPTCRQLSSGAMDRPSTPHTLAGAPHPGRHPAACGHRDEGVAQPGGGRTGPSCFAPSRLPAYPPAESRLPAVSPAGQSRKPGVTDTRQPETVTNCKDLRRRRQEGGNARKAWKMRHF